MILDIFAFARRWFTTPEATGITSRTMTSALFFEWTEITQYTSLACGLDHQLRGLGFLIHGACWSLSSNSSELRLVGKGVEASQIPLFQQVTLQVSLPTLTWEETLEANSFLLRSSMESMSKQTQRLSQQTSFHAQIWQIGLKTSKNYTRKCGM